ncbi:hypothetical protein [Maritimibacter sp. HL-12]|uniref:hypothetical protein n=1 Tax=Maritimibacter sp. HL-12 TaxID=1162418 RepID=UPI000A1CCBA4|nr:hypothetical protein [Maritimibacter sp. HL-12]
MNVSAFLRDFVVLGTDVAPIDYRHRPAVVAKPTETLDEVPVILATLRKDPGHDETVMLLGSPGMKRMIAGSDALRSLLRGMGAQEEVATADAPGP